MQRNIGNVLVLIALIVIFCEFRWTFASS